MLDHVDVFLRGPFFVAGFTVAVLLAYAAGVRNTFGLACAGIVGGLAGLAFENRTFPLRRRVKRTRRKPSRPKGAA